MKQYVLKVGDVEPKLEPLLAAGAQWVTLATGGATDAEIVAAIERAIPACRAADVILVVEGHAELALTTVVDGVRASGVIVSAADGHPAEIREQLGPHAIIGYAASEPAEILTHAGQDIDYFTLEPGAMTAELAAKVATPIVAVGAGELPEGFRGIAVEA